jgi:hypothetical protein
MSRLLITELMGRSFRRTAALAAAVVFSCVCAGVGYGQPVVQPQVRMPATEEKKEPETRTVREMLAKQQITRRKKEYEEMLKQGDEALRLSQELEESFEVSETLSDGDLQKLQELEKIVSKIREDLGGNDGGKKAEEESADSSENSARSSVAAAFKFLRSSTIRLVDELKRSTRFSISVAAIQASNSVIKFARFLRLRK